MTASPTAPDAMPGERELALLLLTFGEFGTYAGREFDQASACSRAILALFAPILAEKEREYELASEGRAAFAARALSAEAALAEERERCAKVADDLIDIERNTVNWNVACRTVSNSIRFQLPVANRFPGAAAIWAQITAPGAAKESGHLEGARTIMAKRRDALAALAEREL